MRILIEDDFDLDKIAESGQCFRWEKLGEVFMPEQPEPAEGNYCPIRRVDGENSQLLEEEPAFPPNEPICEYRIIAGSSCLYITSLGNGFFELDCSEESYSRLWKDYFDLRENYADIRAQIIRDQDPFLWEAAEREKGIRILRQDPWEMLITFIVSQNRNIPAIRRSVELLSESCGDRKMNTRGRAYYAFPSPQALSELSEQALADCGLGYRDKYVKAAAVAVAEQRIDLDRLRTADVETAVSTLTGLYGVGVKVANCISLFGLHHVNAFPIDVWVRRILEQEYPEGYPFERYAPYNGIYQQYMFAYYRHRERC